MSDERKFITPQQAESLLMDGENIHTFVNPNANILIGADWSREEIVSLFNKHSDKIEIGGDACRSMGHGIVVWRSSDSPLFIESDKDKLNQFDPIPEKQNA